MTKPKGTGVWASSSQMHGVFAWMRTSDDLQKKRIDAWFVSQQYHEVEYMMKIHQNLTRELLKEAVDAVGHGREKVEAYLRSKGVEKRKLIKLRR